MSSKKIGLKLLSGRRPADRVAQANNLDTYFGKVQKQVCVAGVGVPVLAAVQAPTLGELIADAAARASERLSERIAKGDR